MLSCCRPSIPAPISATKLCLDLDAPSILHVISLFRSTCSATGIRHRRATPARRRTARAFRRSRCSTMSPANTACSLRSLGVRRIALVLGWSLAAMQAYQWAAQYPDMVDAILPYCGAARCSALNYAFLDGPKAALQADAAWNDGNYMKPPEKGLQSLRPRLRRLGLFARLLSRRALSRARLRHARGFRARLGGGSSEVGRERSPRQDLDVAARRHQRQSDLSRRLQARALQSIHARAIVMPCRSDMYFVPTDNAAEVAAMPRAELRVFDFTMGPLCGLARPGARVPTRARRSRRRIVERMKT